MAERIDLEDVQKKLVYMRNRTAIFNEMYEFDVFLIFVYLTYHLSVGLAMDFECATAVGGRLVTLLCLLFSKI